MDNVSEIYDNYIFVECECDYGTDSPKSFFDLGASMLVEKTKHSTSRKVKGIRKQYQEGGYISEKQQWVLAFWCADNLT